MSSSSARTLSKKVDKSLAPPVSPAPSRRDAKLLITPQHNPPAESKRATPKASGSKAKKSIEEEGDDETEQENVDTANFDAEVVSPRKSPIEVTWRTEQAYKILQKTTGQLGGNGYNGAIYGELTMRSMQRVLNILVNQCGLTSSSRFIDVGAGLGKPNIHAAQDPACRLSIGVELEEIRWQLSMHNMDHFLPAVEADEVEISSASASAAPSKGKGKKTESEAPTTSTSSSSTPASAPAEGLHGGVHFILDDIDSATSMDPFTHIYMFDLGFPPPLQQSIAKKFNESVHAEYLVSYRPERSVIGVYGFAVELVAQQLCSMHGSGEGHTAYIYKRTNKAPTKPKGPSNDSRSWEKLLIPGRSRFNEKDTEVYCDKAFFPAAKLAVGPTADLRQTVKDAVNAHMDASRGKRDRKPRVITDASNF
ncbi:hypothetical protein B484DRAFT_402394 [Ochromonadaceae sp. CCMP2298]|nr:hypothetical protein B484DRAFT_402394 [Ochromonadaceae sp. CCMP2298]